MRKKIISEDEIKRYKDLMGYNSKKSNGLLSENHNTFLVEVFDKEHLSEDDRIRSLHLTAIDEQNKKRVNKNINLGIGKLRYTKSPSSSKGYAKSGSLDPKEGLGSFAIGYAYQSLYGKNRQSQIKEYNTEEDAKLIYDYMINGKKVSKNDFNDFRAYNFIDRAENQISGDNLRGFGGKFRTIYQVLKDEKAVINKLVQTSKFQTQLTIWEDIKINDPAYAADIIMYVLLNKWVERVVLKKMGVSTRIPDEEIVYEKEGTEGSTPGDESSEPGEEESFVELQGADFGLDSQGVDNLYLDNMSKADTRVKTKINEEIINPILEVLQNIPETVEAKKIISKVQGKKKITWRACVNSISGNASASRFRNTSPADKLTFKQLAELRLNNAKDYLISELMVKYQMPWCKKEPIIKLNPNGSNGDGTSGPNPPKDLGYYIPKGEYPMTKACSYDVDECKINGILVKRDECGLPHSNKKSYDKYKYTNLNVEVAFNFDLMDLEEPFKDPPIDDKKEGGKESTPPIEDRLPKEEVQSSDKTYSADFYGGEKFTEIKRRLTWKWAKLKRKGGGVKLGGESYIGRKVKTIKCYF
jgi:hypothetical protein